MTSQLLYRHNAKPLSVSQTSTVHAVVTLWHLCRQCRRDSDKIEVSGAVMDRHLFALAFIQAVAVTLIHKAVQWKAPPYQHPYRATTNPVILDFNTTVASHYNIG